MSADQERTRQAIYKCGEWLATCRRLGWRYEDLDWLEALWWKYHDHRGNLISDMKRVNA